MYLSNNFFSGRLPRCLDAVHKAAFLIVFSTLSFSVFSQQIDKEADQTFFREIYNTALRDGRCYEWLEYLSLEVGHRLSGSVGAEKAVAYTKSMLDTLGLDRVWLQEVMVPRWVRGAPERVFMSGRGPDSEFRVPLSALALGGSVGAGPGGIKAGVVEIKDWQTLDSLGAQGLKGKIVFYNRPMDPTCIHTFEAYGGSVDQRVYGASRAAKYGALAVLVRSMGLSIDDYPHTGTLRYDSAYALIPAAAISTLAAGQLSEALRNDPDTRVEIMMDCATLPDVLSHNVIGEIRGTEFPEKVILVGGHLDSWDVGHGAHDDGAGCVQSMDVLRYFRQLGYRPRHTIRCVLFMNEENGLRGGVKYAEAAEAANEFHVCAIESDAGGFTPRGFTFDAEQGFLDNYMQTIAQFRDLFAPYGLELKTGGSGADISPLKRMKGLLCGYRPDSQRYFDYHHTANDTFDKVNKRELELGAASMAALVYLLDKYGL